MPSKPDTIITEALAETGATWPRATLTVRAGSVIRPEAASNAAHRVNADHAAVGVAGLAAQNGAVPLTRLTAGRKEMKIAHDGATYLLRITKSNKLILTKEEVAATATAS